jgi:hypothetical protein
MPVNIEWNLANGAPDAGQMVQDGFALGQKQALQRDFTRALGDYQRDPANAGALNFIFSHDPQLGSALQSHASALALKARTSAAVRSLIGDDGSISDTGLVPSPFSSAPPPPPAPPPAPLNPVASPAVSALLGSSAPRPPAPIADGSGYGRVDIMGAAPAAPGITTASPPTSPALGALMGSGAGQPQPNPSAPADGRAALLHQVATKGLELLGSAVDQPSYDAAVSSYNAFLTSNGLPAASLPSAYSPIVVDRLRQSARQAQGQARSAGAPVPAPGAGDDSGADDSAPPAPLRRLAGVPKALNQQRLNAWRELAAADPDTFFKLRELSSKEQEATSKALVEHLDLSARVVNGIMSAPPEQRDALWQEYRPQLEEAGITALPQSWSPEVEQQAAARIRLGMKVVDTIKADQEARKITSEIQYRHDEIGVRRDANAITERNNIRTNATSRDNNVRTTSTSRSNNAATVAASRDNNIRSTTTSASNNARTTATSAANAQLRGRGRRGGGGASNGAVAQLPDGRHIVVRNGAWVDAQTGAPVR